MELAPLNNCSEQTTPEAEMGLRNRIPDLLTNKGWDTKTFVAYCMLEGLGQDTAYRLIRGETDFTTKTLATVAKVLGVRSICEIIDVDCRNGEQ
jgi:hypothetical protein